MTIPRDSIPALAHACSYTGCWRRVSVTETGVLAEDADTTTDIEPVRVATELTKDGNLLHWNVSVVTGTGR